MATTSEYGWGLPPCGYRLPASTHPGSVTLQVADIERSLDWYGSVLGLAVLGREQGRVDLGVAEGSPALVRLVERKGAAAVPRAGRLGLYHFAVLLPERADLARFLRHVGELGVRFGASDHLVSEALYLADPDGLGVEVYCDRPRADWEHRDRQLVMATDPLDTDSLLAAAGPGHWDGLPPGTVIGHLHLHVGDLAVATDFYAEALGLDRVVWNYPGALFLSAGGYHHHLGVNTWARGAASPSQDDARLLEWTLELPDRESLEAAAASLRARGYTPEVVGGEPPSVRVRDPWGTALRLEVTPPGDAKILPGNSAPPGPA